MALKTITVTENTTFEIKKELIEAGRTFNSQDVRNCTFKNQYSVYIDGSYVETCGLLRKAKSFIARCKRDGEVTYFNIGEAV
mgnify:CR=1 FL=1